MAKTIGTSALMDVWATGGSVVTPDISKIDGGWNLSEQPPHETMNWLHASGQEKINHILSRGAPDWNAETPYGIGASVNRSGRLWLALVSNTNSEPAAGNSNWSKVWDDQDSAASLAAQGWQKLSSGLVMQWVSGVSAAGGVISRPWPTTFPNAIFPVVITERSAGGWVANATAYGDNGSTTTNLNALAKTLLAGGSQVYQSGLSYNAIAVGY